MELKKSPKVNLEKKRIIFLEIGLVLALGICFAAFEWSTEEVKTTILSNNSNVDYFEDEIVATFQEDEPEPIVEEEPEIIIEIFKVEENDVDTDAIEFSSESSEGLKTDIIIITENIDEEINIGEIEPIIFAKVEEKPTYIGGDIEMLKFINKNSKYPKEAKEAEMFGTVFIQFVISESGKLTNVKVAHGIDPYLDAEALRVVSIMPSWNPGKQRGIAIPVSIIIPIKFVLE